MALLERLIKRFRHSVIQPDCPEGKVGRPLMTRYYIFRSALLGVFVHQFHRSDLDEFHDHPWHFFTFLFHRGYWEHRPLLDWRAECAPDYNIWTPHEVVHDVDGVSHIRCWRPRFSVLSRPALYRHYIEVMEPGDTWTLVIRLRRVRDWGFIVNNKWIHWKSIETAKSRSICEEE